MEKFYQHALPGETGGESTWFYRQNLFEQQEVSRQVAFKRRRWPELANGKLANRPQHTYPQILPEGNLKKVYFPPIADEILDYTNREDIAIHSEALNLKSSQVACFNFLFPFHQNLHLATAVFHSLFPGLHSVSGIEFEYTGPLDATICLGEPLGGKRGQNRTSIDAAVFWLDGNGIRHGSLIEWKYTERNFGVCSAFAGATQSEKAICQAIDVANNPKPADSCILTSGKRHCSRHYWELMQQAGIHLSTFYKMKSCPFEGPFYQIMRQFLLGDFLKKASMLDEYEILSFQFIGNKNLNKLPDQLKPFTESDGLNVVDAWNKAIKGASPMRHIYVDEWMKTVDHIQGIDQDWRAYILERYGV